MRNKAYFVIIFSLIILLSSCVTVTTESNNFVELEQRYQTFNSIENFNNWDILHFFAAIGTYDEMLLVIKYADNIECHDLLGNTPIMIAQRYNNIQSYEALLFKGSFLEWLNLFSPENSKKAHEIASLYGYEINDNINSRRKFLPETSPTNVIPPDLNYNYFDGIEDYPFNPLNTNFSKINCWFLSECSFLSYAPPAFAESIYNKAGYENFKFIEVEDNECMIIWNDESIIISFRGTEQNSPSTASDVLTDLKTRQTSYEKGGYVHRGFLEAFNSLWFGDNGLDIFINRLKKDEKDRAIWITGHSLGGALADICFTQMDDATGVYTFGAPRVGDEEFVNLTIGRNRWRVEHNQDPVTIVPISLSLIHVSYYNIGDLIYIGKYGQVLDLTNTKYNELKLNYTESFIEQDFLRVFDHMPINYSLKLWNSL